jgi:hypothetical protein
MSALPVDRDLAEVCLARKQFDASKDLPCLGGSMGSTTQKRLADIQARMPSYEAH